MADSGGPVRPGEALDVPAVHAWLRARLPHLPPAPPAVTQYAGGASNWTYRLQYPEDDLVLRRPPEGRKAKSAHDVTREYRLQAALRPAFPYVPEMVASCTDPAVLGCDFYVMRRIPGLVPRKEFPVPLAPDLARRLCERAVDALVALHAVDPASAGLEGFGKGTGYVRRQVEGWAERYTSARTPDVPSFGRVIEWLRAQCPDDVATVPIHNDFRLDNLVLDEADPTRILGVLDWELATLGDPLTDLGAALAYWVEAGDDPIVRATRRQPTHLPGMFTRAELVARYLEKTGRSVPDFRFYEVLGMFRLAGIAQQIYWRYRAGQTRNPAFRRFGWIVAWLDLRCLRRIGWREVRWRPRFRSG